MADPLSRGPFSVSRRTETQALVRGPPETHTGGGGQARSVSCEATVKSQEKSQQIRVSDHRTT